MLGYLVTPAIFKERQRRFTSTNDKKSQAEVMIIQEEDIITLYFHDIDKVYTTKIFAGDDARIYLSNFLHKIPILDHPTELVKPQIIPIENKLVL